MVNRFLVDHVDLFENDLPELARYLFVYIEPLDLTEETQSGYLRLIGRSFLDVCQKRTDLSHSFSDEEKKVFDDDVVPYAKRLETLKKLISQVVSTDLEVVLFLGEIDELTFVNSIFCNNLRSLWNQLKGTLHYVFLIKDVRLFFTPNYYSEDFGYLFFQNVLYVPVTSDNEEYLVKNFEKNSNYVLSPEVRKVVSQMCDGHPYFLKLAIESLAKYAASGNELTAAKVAEILHENYEIRSVSDRMVGVLTEDMRKILAEVSRKKVTDLPTNDEAKTLLSLGLIKKTADGYFRPFCQLFEDAILKKTMPEPVLEDLGQNIGFDEKFNAVAINGKPVEEKLTRQEHQLLASFLRQPNKLFARDEIAEVIWAKESYEKYSDWAIDQLISKLRKKLADLGVAEKALVTVRGRGYKFNLAG